MDKPNLGLNESKAEPAEAKSCVPVDFATAGLAQTGGRLVLKVSGQAPHPGMTIEAHLALKVLYVKQPDYLPLLLVACVPAGTKLSGAAVAFNAEIDVTGSIGIKGVDLVGKAGSKPKRLELAG